MKLVPIVMVFLSMLLFAVTASFFIENIAFFQPEWSALMDDVQFYISFSAALVSGILYIVLARRYYNVNFSPFFFLLFVALFAWNYVGLALYPLSSTLHYLESPGTFTLTFTEAERIRFALDFAIVCFLLYVEFTIMPKTIPSRRLLSLMHYAMVIAAIAMVVFSLVREWDIYRQYFDPNRPWTGEIRAMSFTNNPNTYGFALMCAIMSCAYLHARNRIPVLWWLLMFVFFVAMCTTLSRTSIFASVIFMLFYFVHNIVRNLRHSGVRVLISVLVFFGIIITYVILKFTLPPDNFIVRFADGIIYRSLGSYSSRIDIWNAQLAILSENPIRYVFGIGEKQAWVITGAFANLTYFAPSHNALLNQVFCGGVIRLLIYFVLVGYIFYKAITSVKRSKVMPLCLGMTIVFMIHGLGEDTSFLNGEGKAFIIFLLSVLPILVESHLEQEAEAIREYKANAVVPKPLPKYVYSPIVRTRLAFFFSFFIIVTIVGGLPLLQQAGHLRAFNEFQILALGGAALIFFPMSIYCLSINRDRSLRNFLTVIYSLLFIGIAIPVLLVPGQWLIIGIGIGVMALLTLLAFIAHPKAIPAVKEGFFLRAFLPFISLSLILYVPYLLVRLYDGGVATTYHLVALLVLEVFAAAIFFATPFGHRLIYPLPIDALLIDGDIMRLVFAHEAKLEEADRRFYEGPRKTVKIHRNVYEVHVTGAKKGINPKAKPYLKKRRD